MQIIEWTGASCYVSRKTMVVPVVPRVSAAAEPVSMIRRALAALSPSQMAEVVRTGFRVFRRLGS